MKAVDIQKVRTAILSLQTSGAKESAQAVWDLLDDYISQRPQPLVMKSYATLEPWSHLPKCEITQYMGGEKPCTTSAIGHLLKGGRSYLMCDTHGKAMESPGHAEWVQTHFGDEDE